MLHSAPRPKYKNIFHHANICLHLCLNFLYFIITRLTAYFVWPDVWSGDLHVYKKYGHTWHRMPLLRPGVIKQHKLNQSTFHDEHYTLKFSNDLFTVHITFIHSKQCIKKSWFHRWSYEETAYEVPQGNCKILFEPIPAPLLYRLNYFITNAIKWNKL